MSDKMGIKWGWKRHNSQGKAALPLEGEITIGRGKVDKVRLDLA